MKEDGPEPVETDIEEEETIAQSAPPVNEAQLWNEVLYQVSFHSRDDDGVDQCVAERHGNGEISEQRGTGFLITAMVCSNIPIH